MAQVWAKTKLLLVPINYNDICGTRRVTIEAFRHGIPVLISDRCGVAEKVPAPMLIPAEAPADVWQAKIGEVTENYEQYRCHAEKAWTVYDTATELANFEKILLQCVSS
jgi:glycosyltransferase involved in cell wall biosynthesis